MLTLLGCAWICESLRFMSKQRVANGNACIVLHDMHVHVSPGSHLRQTFQSCIRRCSWH